MGDKTATFLGAVIGSAFFAGVFTFMVWAVLKATDNLTVNFLLWAFFSFQFLDFVRSYYKQAKERKTEDAK